VTLAASYRGGYSEVERDSSEFILSESDVEVLYPHEESRSVIRARKYPISRDLLEGIE